jgi:DNA/RNA endonuclease G (NUC1)
MFATPETQLYKNQYDALFESTEKNPYLTASTRASRNKALKTEKKRSHFSYQ